MVKEIVFSSVHSIREPNAINEHIYIPDIYKALGNPKWRFCGSFKHSFAFVSHFIAEEGYSTCILTETSSHKLFFSQWQQIFMSYYHAWLQL